MCNLWRYAAVTINNPQNAADGGRRLNITKASILLRNSLTAKQNLCSSVYIIDLQILLAGD